MSDRVQNHVRRRTMAQRVAPESQTRVRHTMPGEMG